MITGSRGWRTSLSESEEEISIMPVEVMDERTKEFLVVVMIEEAEGDTRIAKFNGHRRKLDAHPTQDGPDRRTKGESYISLTIETCTGKNITVGTRST